MTSNLDTVCRLFARPSLSVFVLFAAFALPAMSPRLLEAETYSESFTGGQGASSQAEQDWVSFRASLTPSTYESVTIRGTFDPVGRTLIDATIVPQIALAVSEGNGGSWLVGNVTWNVGLACGSSTFATTPVELNANSGNDTGVCHCTSPGYIIRPNIGNDNWGGVNTNTCNGPSQTITVIFSEIGITSRTFQ